MENSRKSQNSNGCTNSRVRIAIWLHCQGISCFLVIYHLLIAWLVYELFFIHIAHQLYLRKYYRQFASVAFSPVWHSYSAIETFFFQILWSPSDLLQPSTKKINTLNVKRLITTLEILFSKISIADVYVSNHFYKNISNM